MKNVKTILPSFPMGEEERAGEEEGGSEEGKERGGREGGAERCVPHNNTTAFRRLRRKRQGQGRLDGR
jgi:hypothetical protein